MKFLCVPCDSPMKMQTIGPPERGSLSVVYSCPECGYEMAMLTNPFETQLVQSLDVHRTGIGSAAWSGGAPSTAGFIAANGQLVPAALVVLPVLDAPAPISGPIRTPSDWTICVSYALVSIAIS